jgi:hypothetical protein
MRLRTAVLLTVAVTTSLPAAQIPKLKTQTLDNRTVRIPADSETYALVLVFGFTRESAEALDAWDALLAPKYASAHRVQYWQLPVLQGVPFFVKPIILREMRKSIRPGYQSRLAPLFKNAKQLRSMLNVTDPNAAYVVVANPLGVVAWQTHARASPQEFRKLQAAVATLLAAPGIQ